MAGTDSGGTMKCWRFRYKNASLSFDDVPIPEPGTGEVRVKIYEAGVCATDHFAQHGTLEESYPRIPGHEVVGIIDQVGAGVTEHRVGDRVGVGWTAYFCGQCDCCRSGDTACCENVEASGVHRDGGYAEYMIVPRSGIAHLPKEMSFVQGAPMMDAGLTMFNALRHSIARPGDLVAIVGIGGLGHLGLQFANKFGFRVAAVSHTEDKEQDVFSLGAHYFINSNTQDIGEELLKLGGAKVIAVTATTPKIFVGMDKGLAPHGQVMVLTTLQEPIPIGALNLLMKRASISVWNTGDAKDIEMCCKFAMLHNIKAVVEEYPFDKADEAYSTTQKGISRYRAVLKVREEEPSAGII